MNPMFTAMLAAATAKVEVPIDGSTGVWVKSGTTVISSGMKMTGATITSGQSQLIYNCGTAQSCTFSASAIQRVYSGGKARGCDVLHFQYVSAGGTAINTIARYRQYVSSGGSAVGTILRVAPELAASIYPAADIATGAFASGFVVESRGSAWVHTVSAYDFTAVASGYIQVYTGGVLSGVTVESTGRLYVASGGTALAVVSAAGATVNVVAGGYIEYA